MVKAFIKHLQNNSNLIELLGGDNICYLEKPLNFNPEQYLLIKDKLLSQDYITEYQVQVDVIGKDPTKIIEIEKELRSYLDDWQGQKKNTGLKQIRVLNGGGTLRDGDNFIKVVYFLCKV